MYPTLLIVNTLLAKLNVLHSVKSGSAESGPDGFFMVTLTRAELALKTSFNSYSEHTFTTNFPHLTSHTHKM